jgi:hypothetical protein
MSPSRRWELRINPPYDKILGGAMSFATLAETEETMERLDKLRQRFLVKSDKKGVDYCRQLALLGRRRAEMIAANRHVDPGKRRLKTESALWFRIWLETPDLFADWLALRKRSAEFQEILALETRTRNAGKK